MGQLHHFTYGPITPIFAYSMSFLGCLLGGVLSVASIATRLQTAVATSDQGAAVVP